MWFTEFLGHHSKSSSSKFILNATSLRTVHIRAHLKYSWCHLKSFYQATRRSSNCHEQSTPNNLRKDHDSPCASFDDSFKVWSCSYDPWLILCRTRFKVHRDCLCGSWCIENVCVLNLSIEPGVHHRSRVSSYVHSKRSKVFSATRKHPHVISKQSHCW